MAAMTDIEFYVLIIYYVILALLSFISVWFYQTKVNWFIIKKQKVEHQEIGRGYVILALIFLAFGILGYGLIFLIPNYRGVSMFPAGLDLIALLIGGILILVSTILLVLSLKDLQTWQLVTGKEEEELKTTGIFQYIRHPQDLAVTLAFIAIWIMTNSWLGLIIAALVGFNLYRTSAAEEARYQYFFPQEWQQYQKETNRWLSWNLLWPK